MPVYQYQCKNCSHSFEEMHSISNREIPINSSCSSCGEKQLYIVLSPIIWADSYRMGITKPRSDFTERIKQIQKGTPGHKIDIV